jgi:outer membrane lipase/esterase
MAIVSGWQGASFRYAAPLAACLLFCFHATAQEIVAFGDSLSDDGTGLTRVLEAGGNVDVAYPPPPYYDSHWTNGPTAIEVAAAALNASLLDYAVGGSTSGADPSESVTMSSLGNRSTELYIPSLLDQVTEYLDEFNGTDLAGNLYFIWTGGNDILDIGRSGANFSATAVAAAVEEGMTSLYDGGARRFILVTIPPAQTTPAVTLLAARYGPAVQVLTAEATDSLNAEYQQLAVNFPAQYPDASVGLADVNSFLLDVAAAPAALGFTNVNESCVPVVTGTIPAGLTACANPDQHLFWDGVHPTARVHQLIGTNVFATLIAPLLASG